MTHTCPYDHQHLPLPEGIQEALEAGISTAIAGGTEASVPTEDLTGTLVTPLVELLNPWVPSFRRVLPGRTVLAQRISHQILEFLAQMLEDGGLTDTFDSLFTELSQEDPRLSPGFSALGLEIRVALRSDHQGRIRREVGAVSRGMSRLARRGLPRFLDGLLLAAEKYRETEDRVRSAMGSSSGLWDLEPGIWETREGVNLQSTAEFLSQEPSITTMLDTLGRRGLQDPRFAPASDPAQETALGRQEIVGLELGRNLESILPSQLATLADPRGQAQFFAEYADGRLSQYSYQTRRSPPDINTLSSLGRKESDLGPFVLCIDTSGSMDGLPEQAAKALSLAAVYRSMAQDRALVLISFSHETRVLEWAGDRSVKEYLDFLGHSFRGGTDLRPALDRSIQFLQSGVFQDGDLLIISDFRIPKIMVKKSHKLLEIQEELGTRIHALTVGKEPIVDDYNMFDSRWIFYPVSGPLESRLRETRN